MAAKKSQVPASQLGLFAAEPAPAPPPRRRAPAALAHHCHARGCTRAVKPELLMCGYHWRMVPRVIQQAVWRHYRPGQCDDKAVSRAWLEAADAAIGFVASRERRPLTDAEKAATAHFLTIREPT